MKKMILGLLTLAYCFILQGQSETRLMRFPTVFNDKIIFSYAGDLYSVSTSGGTAQKLTSHIGYEMFPRFSPNGSQIAFTAQYDGNTEVYLMPASGGTPKRLTYTATLNRDDISDRMGPNNIVMTWTVDGKNIIYRSRKQSFNDFIGQLFSVPVQGGMSQQLPLPAGGFCSYSPDGKKLAYNRIFREFRTWKYYKGGMADDIWIYDFTTKKTENITNNPAQDIFPMWHDKNIYFCSDRDRTMNLFVYNTENKQTRKLTNFTEYDIKFPSLGNNAIVFENGGYIYLFDLITEKSQKVTIQINADNIYSRNEFVDASKFINKVQLSPDANRLLINARGDIFTVPYKTGITRNLTKTSGVHEREPVWSPNGKYLAYLSDTTGEFEIYIVKQDGSEPPIQLTKNADTYPFKIVWSPDSKKILWNDRKMRLQYVIIETKEVVLVDKSSDSEIHQFSWSPDSKWIAFNKDENREVQTIFLFNTTTKTKYAVTDKWFDSYAPVFSNDGNYLVFISNRTFNPIYSNTEWNHAYIDMSKIYIMLLSKETPSPFAPENNEVSVTETTSKTDDKATTDKKNKTTTTAQTTTDIKIDIDGISSRIIELPIAASNYWNVTALNNKIYYCEKTTQNPIAKLKYFDLKEKKEIELGDYANYIISQDEKKMLIINNKAYYVIDIPSSKIQLDKPVDLSSLKMWINKKREWEQIYNECWRQMRDFFYDPNMHKVDWKAMHTKYAQLLPYVNHRADLNYIIGELIGELNVGHAYIGDGDIPKPNKINLGLLGAKISKHISGYFRIDSILIGASWSAMLRSPLNATGITIKAGDYITAIDGVSVKPIDDIYTLLIDKADKQVEITVTSDIQNAPMRKYIIEPIADESELYYYNWVQNNIAKVTKATNGKVGYIHIPDMVNKGLNEFVKYYYPQLSKEALIIDDRGNGGGNVSPMIIERLRRQMDLARMFRNSEVGKPGRGEIFLGPKVLLINEYSASDGDLFAYQFKINELGKVIGKRTWGGVVGIRGSLPIIDGGSLMKPEFAHYAADGSGWIIEGHGVDPDIVIDNDPAKEFSGEDEQLNKAIEIILNELKTKKQTVPPIPAFPDKSK